MLFLPWVASTQAVRNDLSRSLLTCILILYRVIWYLSYIDILVYTWWIAILYIFMLNKFYLSPESWVLSPAGLWSPGGEVGTVAFRLFPRSLLPYATECNGCVGEGNQRMSFHQSAKLVIAQTDLHARSATIPQVSSQSICVVIDA